ncbi:MAG: L,D-transpeptidase [Luteolibacter sp.]
MAALTVFQTASAQETKQEPESKTEVKNSETKETWDSEKRQAALRVQLFLDEKGFGPGKIDAHWGGFTEKAAERWNASGNSPEVKILDSGDLDLASATDLPFSENLTTTYTITDSDQKMLGDLPDSPEEKAKLKELPYSSLLELVSEKFHVDPDFVKEINELGSDDKLEVGTELKVPNVSEPFDIEEVLSMAEKAKEDSKDENQKDSENAKSSNSLEMNVLLDDRVVELRDGETLVHSFPISPGAKGNQTPAGDWKVSVISWMPEFRWDKSMLENGERSENSHMLPPGPNNPVGIVWIGLTADGIGLHGTPYPDAIGRNESHGCIRLANWDALKLGKAITLETPVIVK